MRMVDGPVQNVKRVANKNNKNKNDSSRKAQKSVGGVFFAVFCEHDRGGEIASVKTVRQYDSQSLCRRWVRCSPRKQPTSHSPKGHHWHCHVKHYQALPPLPYQPPPTYFGFFGQTIALGSTNEYDLGRDNMKIDNCDRISELRADLVMSETRSLLDVYVHATRPTN